MPIPRPLWAALRETSGQPLPTREPKAALLAAHPELRGLSVRELSATLGVREDEAERIVSTFLRESVPADVLPSASDARGLSLDARIVLVGRPAPPTYMKNGAVERNAAAGVARVDDAGAIGTFDGTEPLKLGFFYKLPFRGVWGKDGAPVSVDAPTAYDAQVATILRAPIDADPSNATMPHPAAVRAFAVAMGLQSYDAQGLLTFQAGGVAPENLAPSARGVVEDVGSWPEPQPGEVFPVNEIQSAFDAFRWYLPLSGDVETADGKVSWDWDSSDNVTRERYVFWYAKDDGAWNKCCQISGFSKSANGWILPSKWGSKVWVWQWRPTDSQTVGEWRTFFNWDRWNVENKSGYMAVAAWIAAALITVATLGAGAGALAGAAAFQAALAAGTKLFDALAKGNPSAAVQATIELGAAMNSMSDGGSFVAALKANNPSLAKFAEGVAAPFQKIYEAARGAGDTIESVWSQATALRKQIPTVDGTTWAAAATAFGVNTGAATWLQMARLPSSSDVAAELWSNAPDWAKDVVAVGTAIAAAEQAQSYNVARGVAQLQSVASVYKMGGGVMQIAHASPVAEGKKVWSAVPPPAAAPDTQPLVAVQGNGAKSGGGVVLVAAAAAAFLFLRKG